jgi:hypothetical protein
MLVICIIVIWYILTRTLLRCFCFFYAQLVVFQPQTQHSSIHHRCCIYHQIPFLDALRSAYDTLPQPARFDPDPTHFSAAQSLRPNSSHICPYLLFPSRQYFQAETNANVPHNQRATVICFVLRHLWCIHWLANGLCCTIYLAPDIFSILQFHWACFTITILVLFTELIYPLW